MFKNHKSKLKYGLVDKWAKMTEERARIDAKVYNTYIVYDKNGVLVKEYPNRKIMPLQNIGES